MFKLALLPDNSAYTVVDGKSVVATKLDGGASRYRRDIIGATSSVTCNWIIGPTEYKYLRAFFRTIADYGSKPFLIDLLLDQPALTEHKAYFMPESLQLTGQKGLTYYVTASLEVVPIPPDQDNDALFAIGYSEWGVDWEDNFLAFEAEFNEFINVDLGSY